MRFDAKSPRALIAGGVLTGGLWLGVGTTHTLAGADTTTTSAATTTTTVATSTTTTSTTTTLKVTTTTVKRRPAPVLKLGSRGAGVLKLQRRLVSLHFWLGVPDGVFGDSTQQAVFAFQKEANLPRDGAVGAATSKRLDRGLVVKPRTRSGSAIEINLAKNVIIVVKSGQLRTVLNTSTGGGYTYTSEGVTGVAVTPTGVFHIERQINAMVTAPLGQLWRPKYFVGGYAIHGSYSVPPYPASHGCVRLSIEAINWVWGANVMPLGTKVWVYR
jgi:peptidoglycan hydrolase-like protein with peptidoglycan-binding domain